MLLAAVAIYASPPFFEGPSSGTLTAPLDVAQDRAGLTRAAADHSASSDADAVLRQAMESGVLTTVVDAIHDRSQLCAKDSCGRASLEVLDEARALRSKLREEVVGSGQKAENPMLSASSAIVADAALRKAMLVGELEGLMDAIHANADTASPEMIEKARALRDELKEEKAKSPTTSASSPSAADAALHHAMEAGTLEGLMDALHAYARTASPEVIEEARALRDELRDGKHAAAVQTGTGSSPKPKLSKWASADLLSELFFNAKPKQHLEEVGITVHCWDDTESTTDGGVGKSPEPWRPCSPSDACPFERYGKWWSTSIINWAQRNTFGDHGIILAPDQTKVLCSYPTDGGTMSGGCKMGHVGIDRFNGDDLSQMMSMSMFWSKMGYNEVLIDSTVYNANLPGSIAAFVFNLKGEGKEDVSYFRYNAFLTHFNLTDADIPLLKANTFTWRTQEKQYTNPYACGMGDAVAQNQQQRQDAYAAWETGDCPPERLSNRSAGSTPLEIPLFTDMTALAREYLRANPAPPEPEPPLSHPGQPFRVGANREVPPELERLRSMNSYQREDELARLKPPG